MSAARERWASRGFFEKNLDALLDELDEYGKALREIVEQDPIELALDPHWSQRIASAALAASGERSDTAEAGGREAPDTKEPNARHS